MSEYQYYQFLAVEQPLSKRQQGELRTLSSRAQITADRMLNHYEWGDFKGDPVTLVERYFDAHLYFANWGSRRLVLRVPAAHVALETVLPYCREDVLSAHRSGAHVIIDMTSEDEEGKEGWWVREADWDDEDDHGVLGELIGIRDELSRGDMRPLALACLASATVGPHGRTKDMPDALTAPQRALAAFLRVTG
ncbi:hypothetical protein ACFWMQ_20620 [Streptomyces sp. NPDC058372]|uniref:hypothetical protein n=1 Tax=Streptomyces sp. NPDC058372 TaxID=3346464 RepID=UPI00366A0999